jgi:hypothetical protein
VPAVFATLGAAVRAQLPYWARPAFDATCRDCAAKVDTAVAARDKAAFDRHARETADLAIGQAEADRAEAARAGDADRVAAPNGISACCAGSARSTRPNRRP